MGHWPTQWPYHTFPLSFTVIKMKWDLRGWAEVCVSNLTRHKLTTQEVNVKLVREEGFGGPDIMDRHFKTWFGLSLSFAVLHLTNPVPTKPL